MVKWQLFNADIIDDTDIVTSRFFWKSFDCRYYSRMDYVFLLLTLESSEQSRSPLFSTTCNFNDQILPYAMLLLTFINTHVFYLLSFIYCHSDLLRPRCFPFNSLRPKNYKQLNFRSIFIYLRQKDFRVQITNIFFI